MIIKVVTIDHAVISMAIHMSRVLSNVLNKMNVYYVAAIGLLREREPGGFVIRDSHSFRGAYGLAMKVASPPPSVHPNKKGIYLGVSPG